ncbi:MAG: DMT family transporter [Oscillospiraceae bacterium]|nr:DMT family transporter [Oscillospiraceae bacterium]
MTQINPTTPKPPMAQPTPMAQTTLIPPTKPTTPTTPKPPMNIISRRKGPLLIVAASVCWSLGGLLIRAVPWDAMSINGVRGLLAVLVFIIYRKSFKVSFTRGNVLTAIFLSGTTTFFVVANKMTSAAASILLQFSSSSIFVILIYLVIYRKKPRLGDLVAVTVTIVGMALFFMDQLNTGSLLGNVWAIVSGFAFAGMCVCNKLPDTIPEDALYLGFMLNAAIGVPFVFFEAPAGPYAWGAAVLLGVLQVGLAYVFFSVGIKSTPALLACLITALEPVLNPLWVMLAYGETPGRFSLLGGVVIIVSMISYNVWLEKRREPEQSP